MGSRGREGIVRRGWSLQKSGGEVPISPGVLEHNPCPVWHTVKGHGVKWGSSGLEGRTIRCLCFSLCSLSSGNCSLWFLTFFQSKETVLGMNLGHLSPGQLCWDLGYCLHKPSLWHAESQSPFSLKFLHMKWHSFSSVSPQTGLPST